MWVKEIITNGYVNLDKMQEIGVQDDTGRTMAVVRASDGGTETYYLYAVPYDTKWELPHAKKACQLWLEDLIKEVSKSHVNKLLRDE